jgi:hypothetical protein
VDRPTSSERCEAVFPPWSRCRCRGGWGYGVRREVQYGSKWWKEEGLGTTLTKPVGLLEKRRVGRPCPLEENDQTGTFCLLMKLGRQSRRNAFNQTFGVQRDGSSYFESTGPTANRPVPAAPAHAPRTHAPTSSSDDAPTRLFRQNSHADWHDRFFLLHSNGVRKSIARVLTVINQKQRQNVRELYKSKNAKCKSSALSCRGYTREHDKLC